MYIIIDLQMHTLYSVASDLNSPGKVLGIYQNTSIQLNQAQSETEGKLFIRENDQLGLCLA